MNKELVLREYLAVERTRLVNESTFLAYCRTSLYFLLAGSTLGELVDSVFWKFAGPALIIISVCIMVAGIIRFRKVKKAISESQKNIGESSEAFLKAARGEMGIFTPE